MSGFPARLAGFVFALVLLLSAASPNVRLAAADTTPPTASIIPLSSSTVGGVAQIRMVASDDVAVASVTLLLDGASIGVTSSSPYFINWNTTTASNGPHTLTARALDSSGNPGTSAPLSLTVQNPAFSNEVVVPGITAATTMLFLPDGRMLVGELTETIWVIHAGSSTPETKPFLKLDGTYLEGEQGLMDVILDPNFTSNHWYYIFYTDVTLNGKFNTVSRFTAVGDTTVAGSEVILWQDDVIVAAEHHGGALFFGPGGKLFITVGDQFNTTGESQSLNTFHGKLLRINPDGTIPTDNPFYDGNGPHKDAIWAYGLRNPFRASYDSVSGRIFIGDVGGNDWNTAWEEVNLGVAGANYGWPICEGSCGTAGMTNPFYTYPHLGRDAAVTGGFVYHGGSYPGDYDGSYFFADYAQNWIKRLTFDSSGNLLGVVNFDPPDGAPDGPTGDVVKLIQGLDGSLYYVDIGFDGVHTPNPAAIRRIRPLTNDQPPVAMASVTPSSGAAPLNVNFSSSGSFDPEGHPLTYSWTFGDNTTSTAANPPHTYNASGMYTARLQVSDGVSSTLSNPLTITVGSPPTATVLTPTNGSLFQAGNVITYSGSGLNGAGNPLPASGYSWTILFHHDTHVHPGGTFSGITSGTFTIPSSGHDFSGNTSYEFILTVTDANGLTASASTTIFPDKVNLTFTTQPSSLSLDVDGIRKVTPFVLDAVKGFQYTINAPTQTFGGQSYAFNSWSDGGPQSHQIVVPTSNASWVATFTVAGPAVGLKAAYPFSEGSGTTTADMSGFNNTGTLQGATWTSSGHYGKGLAFNGNSLVRILDSPSVTMTSALTLEAWVYPTVVAAQWFPIIEKMNDDYYLMATTDVGMAPALGWRPTTTLYGPSGLSVNTWSHVAATYDGAMMRLYVNGVQVNSQAKTGALPSSSGGRLMIGGDDFFGQYFTGRIDEVRIYDRALSVSEIQSDMSAPILTSVDDNPQIFPPKFSALVSAAPNPFTPSTRIHFRLASVDRATLRIFNVNGRLVRTFDVRGLTPGEHDVIWTGNADDGSRVAAGVYIASLDTVDGVHRMRIILIR